MLQQVSGFYCLGNVKLFSQLKFPTHIVECVNLAVNKKALAFKTRAFVLELDYVFIYKKEA